MCSNCNCLALTYHPPRGVAWSTDQLLAQRAGAGGGGHFCAKHPLRVSLPCPALAPATGHRLEHGPGVGADGGAGRGGRLECGAAGHAARAAGGAPSSIGHNSWPAPSTGHCAVLTLLSQACAGLCRPRCLSTLNVRANLTLGPSQGPAPARGRWGLGPADTQSAGHAHSTPLTLPARGEEDLRPWGCADL